MGYRRESEGRLLSKPVHVHWDGWETDTYRLQQAGWDISMDQDPYGERMRMVIRNQRHGFIGQTNDIPLSRIRPGHLDDRGPARQHIWQMRHMGRTILVNGDGVSDYVNFRAVDCKPQLSFARVTSLEDLVPFASAPLVRTQALVLPEATVDQLLSEILERQAEAKMDYFKDLVFREGQAAPPAHKFHAQIISLAA